LKPGVIASAKAPNAARARNGPENTARPYPESRSAIYYPAAIMAENQWLGIELRHLAALDAVAREGSFRRAAKSLGYVQSAISGQIAALERAVGQRLVERTRGGGQIELTEAGRLVLQHSDAILARLHAAQADVAALATGHAGELRVGITQSVGVRILPPLMRTFAVEWPEVRLRPTEAAADVPLYEAVERGDVDLSFVELPTPPGPFETVELMADPYVLVVRSDSPVTTLDDLGSVPLIGHTECRGLARVEAQLRARGLDPEFAFRSDVNATIQALVGAGVGAAVLPALAVDQSDRLTTMRDLPGIPPRVLAIVRHRDRHHSAAAQAFVAAAQSVCAGLAPSRRLVVVAE
jgi:molybdate transport repressor ModE-like protein